ncbi:unnamed protein product [Ambrosiozyma monospora]|uniref:Unnamed protein product n=1 Tax=Ambrosiozyma monospora TaxID=43982 RepID=A0A9W7DI65_AMBMO|nr:unnamed protein product [Ambrosiozyma monospora]
MMSHTNNTVLKEAFTDFFSVLNGIDQGYDFNGNVHNNTNSKPELLGVLTTSIPSSDVFYECDIKKISYSFLKFLDSLKEHNTAPDTATTVDGESTDNKTEVADNGDATQIEQQNQEQQDNHSLSVQQGPENTVLPFVPPVFETSTTISEKFESEGYDCRGVAS